MGECKLKIYVLNVIPIRKQAKTELDYGAETAPFASFMVETLHLNI